MSNLVSALNLSVVAVLLVTAFMLGQNTVVGSCAAHGKFLTERTVVMCYTKPNVTDNGELGGESTRRNK